MKNYFCKATICTVLVSCFPISNIFASESIEVFNDYAPTYGKPVAITPRFVVGSGDGTTKRVWIEIEIQTGYTVNADLDPEVITVKRNVNGLSYDEKSHQVLFQPDKNMKAVACGEYVEGNFFTTSRVRANGSCSFVNKLEQRAVDDGFNVRQKAHLLVDLIY